MHGLSLSAFRGCYPLAPARCPFCYAARSVACFGRGA
jgi:hypothetical protein